MSYFASVYSFFSKADVEHSYGNFKTGHMIFDHRGNALQNLGMFLVNSGKKYGLILSPSTNDLELLFDFIVFKNSLIF